MSRVRGLAGTLGSGNRPITSSQIYLRIACVLFFHASNEDESAVSRALRHYYQEKEGFVPDWLTPAIASASAGPSRLSSGGSQASQKPNVSLSDI